MEFIKKNAHLVNQSLWKDNVIDIQLTDKLKFLLKFVIIGFA